MKSIKGILCIVLVIQIAGIEPTDILNCDYLDTVDLTGSTKFANGSYLYENVVIPAELTGEYDYEILFNEERIPVAKHMRGCACQLKPCIRFCCHPKQILVPYARECTKDFNETLVYNPYVNVTLGDGSVIQKHVLDEFLVQLLPVPCALHYALDPEIDEYDNYELFENGTVFRMADKAVLSKADYCIQPDKVGMSHKLLLHNCVVENELPWEKILGIYVMLTSVVCLVLTIATYLALKKLQQLHGKCFIMYLICLAVGYSMLVMDLLGVSNSFCNLSGYIGYVAIMSAFLWLSVISLDLWNTFRGTSSKFIRYTFKNRFLIYNVYVWTIATILFLVVYTVDRSATDATNVNWIPGIGYYSCWIKTHDWSAMIYFYGPMLVLIVFNLVMFVLTAIRIYEVKKELKTIVSRQQRQQRLNSDKQTYSLFLRLFVIMGVTWFLEILSYLSDGNHTLEMIFLPGDILNAAQGIIIFILFVLKRSILKLLADRIQGKEMPDDADCSEEISLQERNGLPSIFN